MFSTPKFSFEAADKRFDMDTVMGRVGCYYRAMNPALLMQTRSGAEKSRNLLKMQKESEAAGGDSVASDYALWKAWDAQKFCFDERGRYTPPWGRIAFVAVPAVVSTVLNISSSQLVSQHRYFLASRVLAHSSTGVGISTFTLYQSANREHSTAETIRLIGFGTMMLALFGLAGEAAVVNLANSNKLPRRLRQPVGIAFGGLIPSIGAIVAVMIAKGKDWSPLLASDPHVDVYDPDGELVAKSDVAGFFGARETALTRFCHAYSIQLLNSVTSTYFLPKRATEEMLIRHATKYGIFFCFVYILTFPLFISMTPSHTKIAARRIDPDLQKAGIPYAYYNRGL
ncbi:hypothetical protein DIPPA_04326 [Diplonema papillatum]|nr:hypothetical protein DIPPA_04326 [Diplonema papillatum]